MLIQHSAKGRLPCRAGIHPGNALSLARIRLTAAGDLQVHQQHHWRVLAHCASRASSLGFEEATGQSAGRSSTLAQNLAAVSHTPASGGPLTAINLICALMLLSDVHGRTFAHGCGPTVLFDGISSARIAAVTVETASRLLCE